MKRKKTFIQPPSKPLVQFPNWIAILLIWGAIFLSYSNSFTISFQFDDTHTVQSNIYIRSLKHIPRYFIDPQTSSYRPENSGYRPMTTTALALGFALSQLSTWGYHLIKLIEHCLVALLIFLVGLKLLPQNSASAPARWWVAFFSALVFGVHRVNTEIVDYISAISSLQAGLFFALAFYLYLRWKDTKKIWCYCLSAFCYMLSMWSKEEGITLPAALLVYEFLYQSSNREDFKTTFKESIKYYFKILLPYIVLAIIFVVLRYSLMDPIGHTSRGTTPRFIYAITQIRSWLYYGYLYFWPINLNADNLSFDFSSGLEDWRIWVSLLVHISIWVFAWKAFKSYRFITFAILWMYITVLPASSVFQLVEAVNEHRSYIPYMFLSLLSVWLFVEACWKWIPVIKIRKAPKLSREAKAEHYKDEKATKYIVFIGLSSLALFLGAGTYGRNKVWQTDVSLWEDIYSKNQNSVRAMNVLGISLLNRGHLERSIQLLERCHQTNAVYLPCMVHLSMAYAQIKEYDRGLEILQKGIKIDPDYPHINFHIGLYYKDFFANYELAWKHLSHVENLTSGRFFQATIKKAEISLEEGQVDKALQMAGAVLNKDITNGEAWDLFGRAYLVKGDLNAANNVFLKLLNSAPHSDRYLLHMANLSERAKDYQKALTYFQHVLTLNPLLIQAWMGLNRIAYQINNRDLVKQCQTKIFELKQSKNWIWVPSMFFLDEKPKQISPI